MQHVCSTCFYCVAARPGSVLLVTQGQRTRVCDQEIKAAAALLSASLPPLLVACGEVGHTPALTKVFTHDFTPDDDALYCS